MIRYINNVGETVQSCRPTTVEDIIVLACEELLLDIENEITMQLRELANEFSEDTNHELYGALKNITSLKDTRDDLVRYIDQGNSFKGQQWALGVLGDWGYTVHVVTVNLANMSAYDKYAYVMNNGIENDIYENDLNGLNEAFDDYGIAIDEIVNGNYRSQDPFFVWNWGGIKTLSEDLASMYLDEIIIKGSNL